MAMGYQPILAAGTLFWAVFILITPIFCAVVEIVPSMMSFPILSPSYRFMPQHTSQTIEMPSKLFFDLPNLKMGLVVPTCPSHPTNHLGTAGEGGAHNCHIFGSRASGGP